MDTTKLSVLKFPFVIIDFGTSYVKCGFAGTAKPHAFIQTPKSIKNFLLPDPKSNSTIYQVQGNLRENLSLFIHHIYIDWLLLDPRTKKVAIVENLICMPTYFKETLAKVLLIDLKVPTMLYIPSHLAVFHTMILSPMIIQSGPNLPSGETEEQTQISELTASFLTDRTLSPPPATPYPLPCALVIDCGYSQITVVPIAGGMPLLSIAKECPPHVPPMLNGSADPIGLAGARALGQTLKRMLLEHLCPGRPQVEPLGATRVIVDKLLEDDNFMDDLAARICLVTPMESSSLYNDIYGLNGVANDSLQGPQELEYQPDILMDQFLGMEFTIPGRMREAACEGFFRTNIDGECIASVLIDCISHCPVDCRKAMAENVIITGGLSMIPGYKNRLKQELTSLVDSSIEYRELPYLRSFKCHNLPCPANYASWLGASILTAASCGSTSLLTSNPTPSTTLHPSANTLSILARYRSTFLAKDKFTSSVGKGGVGSLPNDTLDNLGPFLVDANRLVANRGEIPDWTSLDLGIRPYYRPLGTFSVKGG